MEKSKIKDLFFSLLRKDSSGEQDSTSKKGKRKDSSAVLDVHFDELPEEIRLHIFSFLPSTQLAIAAQVSHEWNRLAYDDHMWSCHYQIHFPRSFQMHSTARAAKGLPAAAVDQSCSSWQSLYANRQRVEKKWRSGTCTHTNTLQIGEIIYSLQFNHEYIVSSSRDDLVRVNEFSTGRRLLTLRGHESFVGTCGFDDTKICSGSWDKSIRVWDIRTGASKSQIRNAHEREVVVLKFKDSTLISGSADTRLKMWDLNQNISTLTMPGHTNDVCSLQFDEHKCVSGSRDSLIKVWDLKTGACVSTIAGHSDGVWAIQYDDYEVISASRDMTLKAFDLRTGKCRITLKGHTNKVLSMMFDDTKVVSGSEDHTCRVWDRLTGKCYGKLPLGHKGKIWALQFDETALVTGSHDMSIRITKFD